MMEEHACLPALITSVYAKVTALNELESSATHETDCETTDEENTREQQNRYDGRTRKFQINTNSGSEQPARMQRMLTSGEGSRREREREREREKGREKCDRLLHNKTRLFSRSCLEGQVRN